MEVVTSHTEQVADGSGVAPARNVVATAGDTPNATENAEAKVAQLQEQTTTAETQHSHGLLSTNAVQGTMFNGGTMYVLLLCFALTALNIFFKENSILICLSFE